MGGGCSELGLLLDPDWAGRQGEHLSVTQLWNYDSQHTAGRATGAYAEEVALPLVTSRGCSGARPWGARRELHPQLGNSGGRTLGITRVESV